LVGLRTLTWGPFGHRLPFLIPLHWKPKKGIWWQPKCFLQQTLPWAWTESPGGAFSQWHNCGSVFVCSVQRNDNGVQNLSGLNNCLVSLLMPTFHRRAIPIFSALHGDGIFATLATIMKPHSTSNEEQTIINIRLLSMRESIEHEFSLVFNQHHILRATWSCKLFCNAECVHKIFWTCLVCHLQRTMQQCPQHLISTHFCLFLLDEVLHVAHELEEIERPAGQMTWACCLGTA